MKKWIKERMSIGKWINGLNSWLLDNTAAVEHDNISETENPLQNDKNSAAASMIRGPLRKSLPRKKNGGKYLFVQPS